MHRAMSRATAATCAAIIGMGLEYLPVWLAVVAVFILIALQLWE